MSPPRSEAAGSSDLTFVELVWIEGRAQSWLRFGRPVSDRVLDRRRRRVGFPPGGMFALVRWRARDGRTAHSSLDILQGRNPGRAYSTAPGVTPGGELLLRLVGWARVRQALQVIDAIEALGVDPLEVAPEHWRHVHNRLSVGSRPTPYGAARHRAWQLRQRLTP